MSEEVRHINRENLLAQGDWLSVYCALTVHDNKPFKLSDYQKEAMQFLEDNQYPPEDGLARASQRNIERMFEELIGQSDKNE